jgi:hypothetical protein
MPEIPSSFPAYGAVLSRLIFLLLSVFLPSAFRHITLTDLQGRFHPNLFQSPHLIVLIIRFCLVVGVWSD